MKIYTKVISFLLLFTIITGCLQDTVYADETQYWPAGPEVVSSSAIVMEASTGTILYEKNIHDRHYPASITKILTTLLAIENSSMDDVVTFSKDAVYNTEGSGIARDVGEQMTMEQCLYAVMLASANECAYAVAEHVAGDIGTFVDMMNKRAQELGCQDTHFNNCNGLPDEEHYTSAYDMALIAREAYQNETFRIICGTRTYTIPVTNKHTTDETYLQNHHQMLYPLKTRKYLYDYCTGGKTGYTTVANNTLVTYAEKDGMTLICVVLDAPASGHYEDTRALFDFCFDNFKLMNVAENETAYRDTEKQQDSGKFSDYQPFVQLDPSGNIVLPVTAEFSDAASEVTYEEKDKKVLGRIRYTYGERNVGGADIVATDSNVDSFPFHDGMSRHKNATATQEENSTQEAGMTDSGTADSGTADSGTKTGLKDHVFQINLRVMAVILAGIILLGILAFVVWKFADNFYVLKRKVQMHTKEKTPYKEIKQNRMYRKRNRRFFK